MHGKQILYYSLGELAYAIARADGKVQREEKDRFHQLMVEAVRNHDIDFDYSKIIFDILRKDEVDFETAYNWSINEMKKATNHFTKELKESFITVLEEVAAAFPPIESEEQDLIDRFKEDVSSI